jgi:hypothetical protein
MQNSAISSSNRLDCVSSSLKDRLGLRIASATAQTLKVKLLRCHESSRAFWFPLSLSHFRSFQSRCRFQSRAFFLSLFANIPRETWYGKNGEREKFHHFQSEKVLRRLRTVFKILSRQLICEKSIKSPEEKENWKVLLKFPFPSFSTSTSRRGRIAGRNVKAIQFWFYQRF